ncbi:MAG: Rieske 2Fe-2S domain-containing protein, partial [Proteobacteria bacterium]|nr:Rieske 2Fe-2S domain-containing protein [Pseudomonadota bacterium]
MFSANTVIGQTGDFAKEQRHKEGFEFKWPAEGLTTIPDWIYTSPEIYEREIERIFHGRTWNFVALEAEIPNPGDYKRSFVGPTPVVVARNTDGAVHVFENRCA